MGLYTSRHGMRKPVKHTTKISVDAYGILLDICEKYYKNLTHLYSLKQHHDFMNKDYIEFDKNKFEKRMNTKIPDLFRNERGQIIQPYKDDEYNQYALIDYIEYIAQNIMDIKEGWDNAHYKNYWDISFLSTDKVFTQYCDEINEIFIEAGILFKLTNDKIVERIVENSPLSSEIEQQLGNISEDGTKRLLEDAIALYKTPSPSARQDSVEKIWDALERLKTYYTYLNKKNSVTKIVEDMSGGDSSYHTLFDDEFTTLTKIGNNFRIRHHETNKIDITDVEHYDYFFNRCLSLISLAIKYLR